MKKKQQYLDVLENRMNLGLSEKIEEKAYNAIKRATDQPVQPFFSLIFRPSVVFVFIALFLVVPLSVVVINFQLSRKNPAVYTTWYTRSDDKTLLSEYIDEDSSPAAGRYFDKRQYSRDVSQVDIRISSRGVIMKWQNPEDIALKEIIIEKHKKKTTDLTKLFPGNVNFYVDPDFGEGDYYIIRCMNKKNIPSRGVYVIPETGDK